MSPKTRRTLKLHKDTVRVLQDQAVVKFGPQTSETVPCCTWDPATQPATLKTVA